MLKNLTNSEETEIIKLIYAREYYRAGFIKKGDEFIKSVERSTVKTNFINKLLEEIRENKKSYNLKDQEKDIELSLFLRP